MTLSKTTSSRIVKFEGYVSKLTRSHVYSSNMDCNGFAVVVRNNAIRILALNGKVGDDVMLGCFMVQNFMLFVILSSVICHPLPPSLSLSGYA